MSLLRFVDPVKFHGILAFIMFATQAILYFVWFSNLACSSPLPDNVRRQASSTRYRLRTSDPSTGVDNTTNNYYGSCLRQNGTYNDIELWNLREDVITLAPIEFTLAPGASADQYELHKYNPSATPGDPVQKLAYIPDSADVTKGFPVQVSLLLVSSSDPVPLGWNLNAWTVTADYWGRQTLGLRNYTYHTSYIKASQNKWILTGEAWNNYTYWQSSDPNGCFGGICSAGVSDGNCFSICGDCYTQQNCQYLECYGVPVEIELVEVDE